MKTSWKKLVRIIVVSGLLYSVICIPSIVIFESLKYDQSVECRAISISGMMGLGYLRYAIASVISPRAVVKIYARSTNPTVKTYAASILCRRGQRECLVLFKSYVDTGEKVRFKCGCITLDERISDLIYWARRSHLWNAELDSLQNEEYRLEDEILSIMESDMEEYLNE